MRVNTRRRINVSLPEGTVRLLNRVARRGDRSRLIDQAVRHYVKSQGRSRLRDLLREGAAARAARDLALASEWFDVEDEISPGRAR